MDQGLRPRLTCLRLWVHPGKYECDFFNSYVLSKFILDITDIGEGKHRQETWTHS